VCEGTSKRQSVCLADACTHRGKRRFWSSKIFEMKTKTVIFRYIQILSIQAKLELSS